MHQPVSSFHDMNECSDGAHPLGGCLAILDNLHGQRDHQRRNDWRVARTSVYLFCRAEGGIQNFVLGR
jgi:hypothetical protein